MSFPGVPQQADDQQQQPLFGQSATNPLLLALQQAQAQRMADTSQQGPIVSPWQTADRALSPLLGALMQKHLANKQFQEQQAALPEIQAALKSDNPLMALMASKSPLVQQMAMQYMPDWMKSQMAVQGEVSKEKLIGPLKTQQAIDTAVGTEKATGPLKMQEEVNKEKALMPLMLEKIRAGQAATYAGQAETARHNKAMESIQGAGMVGAGGNPWDQKWGP